MKSSPKIIVGTKVTCLWMPAEFWAPVPWCDSHRQIAGFILRLLPCSEQTLGAWREGYHNHCLCDPQPTFPHSQRPLRGGWRRASPGLLTQHIANLIKSQIHNTLFKIQMFFTETSRRKGAERNGPTKVIRIHLLGLVPDYSQLIISALCSRRTPRDRIISVLHIHYATNGNTITKQRCCSGKDKISVPSSSVLDPLKFSVKMLANMRKVTGWVFSHNN